MHAMYALTLPCMHCVQHMHDCMHVYHMMHALFAFDNACITQQDMHDCVFTLGS